MLKCMIKVRSYKLGKAGHLFILLLLLQTLTGYSQSKIGVIKDKDGFTNIRSKKTMKVK